MRHSSTGLPSRCREPTLSLRSYGARIGTYGSCSVNSWTYGEHDGLPLTWYFLHVTSAGIDLERIMGRARDFANDNCFPSHIPTSWMHPPFVCSDFNRSADWTLSSCHHSASVFSLEKQACIFSS